MFSEAGFGNSSNFVVFSWFSKTEDEVFSSTKIAVGEIFSDTVPPEAEIVCVLKLPSVSLGTLEVVVTLFAELLLNVKFTVWLVVLQRTYTGLL